MTRRRLAVAVAALAAVTVAALALLGGRADEPPARPADPPREVGRLPPRPGAVLRGPLGAQLVRRAWLRERPGGRVVRALGRRTGFGSDRVLAVVERRRGWLAVLSEHMPNSSAGWIPAGSATLLLEPYTLHVDLSARELVVRRKGRAVRRVTVAVGRPGATTPTGRFAVTDLLRIGGGSGPYGCCALALTGRQRNVPQGWSGGDRIAIHGTPNAATLGTAASSGCLRAGERDIRWLLAHVPLGAPVRIRA